MTIKQQGGIFGRNPTFNNVDVEGNLTVGSVTSSGTTGTGNIVFSTSPSLTTPNIGAASASSLAIGTALDGSLQAMGLSGATNGTTYTLNKWTPSTAEPTTYDLKFTTRFAGAGASAGWQYDFVSRDFYTGSKTYLRFLGGNTVLPDGNLVIGTSGKGIDFSATPGTGTSELLADYEEGTWTPIDGSGADLTFTVLANSAKYTKIGRMVTATFALSYPVTAAAGQATIGGLPFTSGTGAGQGGYLVYTSLASIPGLNVSPSSTIFYLYGESGTGLSNVNMSTQDIRGVVIYFV